MIIFQASCPHCGCHYEVFAVDLSCPQCNRLPVGGVIHRVLTLQVGIASWAFVVLTGALYTFFL